MSLTYKTLYQILIEAEQRVKDNEGTAVAERSQETVALVKQRMCMEGLTRVHIYKTSDGRTVCTIENRDGSLRECFFLN